MLRRLPPTSRAAALALLLAFAANASPGPVLWTDSIAEAQTSAPNERRPQTRPAKTRVAVDPAKVRVDDGDTIDIEWGPNDRETIRILGIDTPETRHVPHNLPYAQSFGEVARGFAMGAFAAANQVEVLRTDTLDPFGRTLAYVFVNGMNYSVLVVEARLAIETVSHYGDNGFAKESAEVVAAAKAAGPVPFEPPHEFRRRMRAVSDWMRERKIYPEM